MRPSNMGSLCACAILAATTPAVAQQAAGGTRPFAIADNSFLVEEAFNQEAGIFQNILLFQRADARAWALEFTQEWPLGSVRHQLSYTVALDAFRPAADWEYQRGTAALHYRVQLLEESGKQPAFSPRLSLQVPQSPAGDRQFGVQLNLPVSKQFGAVYLHGNAGYTVSGISSRTGSSSGNAHLAGSVIHRTAELVHLMLESVFSHDEYGPGQHSLLVSPGVRAGFNFGRRQLVLGAALPLGLAAGDDARALLTYLSYELPFR